jgi:hypothetical protein
MSRSFSRRAFATAVLATAVFATPAPAAQATTRATDPSFVGTYTAHYNYTGQPPSRGTITVDADGTAIDELSNVGYWSNLKHQLSITWIHPPYSLLLTAKQHLNGNLASKGRPGAITVNGTPDGTWYAIKAP